MLSSPALFPLLLSYLPHSLSFSHFFSLSHFRARYLSRSLPRPGPILCPGSCRWGISKHMQTYFMDHAAKCYTFIHDSVMVAAWASVQRLPACLG